MSQRRETLPCKKCHAVLPSSFFPILASGNRRDKCPNCFRKPTGMTHCTVCRQTMPKRGNFRRTTVGYLNICRECERLQPEPERTCPECNVVKPQSDFGRYLNGAKRTKCFACTRKRGGPLACRVCKVVKERTEFGLYRNGNINRSCKACIDHYRERTTKRLRDAPYPCAQCNKTFQLLYTPSRRERVKFCSNECRVAAAAPAAKECILCLKTKPGTEFARRTRSSGFKAFCKTCEAEKAAGTFEPRAGRLSAGSMLRSLKSHARHYKQPCPLPTTFVADIVKKPCEMCGEAMHCLAARDHKKPFDKDNVFGACTMCRDIVRKYGFYYIVDWARRVMDGQGELKGAAPIKRKYTRKLPAEAQLHPDTPMRQPFDETFEQKLARICGARADRVAAIELSRVDPKAYREQTLQAKRDDRAAVRALRDLRRRKDGRAVGICGEADGGPEDVVRPAEEPGDT